MKTKDIIAQRIASRVTDGHVRDLAETIGGNTMVARSTLEAELFSEMTGLPLDYHTDWRDRIPNWVVVNTRMMSYDHKQKYFTSEASTLFREHNLMFPPNIFLVQSHWSGAILRADLKHVAESTDGDYKWWDFHLTREGKIISTIRVFNT